MRLMFAAALVLLPAVAGAQAIQGLALFEQHCALCHAAPAADSRAPGRDVLRAFTPEAILAALTTGSMTAVTPAMSPPQKRLVSEFLSGRPIGAATSGHAAAMKNRCEATPFRNPLDGPSWNGWGNNTSNTRFQTAANAGLHAAVVPKLSLKWAFAFPEGRSAFGQPTVAGGRIYVGSDNGFLYSLDAATGCVHWSFQVEAGIRTAPTVAAAGARHAVFVGDLKANVYAVNAETGALLWTKRADPHALARITGAPTWHAGHLYVPVSSLEEAVGASPGYPCCTFRGSVVSYEASSGRVEWQTFTITDPPKPTKRTSTGAQLWGAAGAAVWASPTVDANRGLLYVSTSNGYTYPSADTTNSVMALELGTGKRVWSRQLTPNDAYIVGCAPGSQNENCPRELGPDFAVGSSPMLVSAAGKDMIVVGQKSGLAWGLDPDDGGAVRWQHRVGQGSTLGDIEWGGAVEGQTVFFPNADARYGLERAGGLSAINALTGERVWFARPRPTCAEPTCVPALSAAATAIPGVVFSGGTDGWLRAFDTRDGGVLWEYQTARAYTTVNGVAGKGGSINGPGPTVVNGMVYTNSGYAYLGIGMPGNVLLAFSVPAQ